jgi:hypothetical protein
VATDRMTLVDVLRKGEDPQADFLQEGLRWLVQELMEAEVSAQIGAGRYERTDERTTQRNGYRTRPWDTRMGTIELAIPKLRSGSYFPSWLEARKRGEQALISVVAEAYVQGVSTRKVEAVVQSLGIAGISKSEVSRMAASLDAQVEAFRAPGGWRPSTPTYGSTHATSTCARIIASKPWPWSSLMGCAPTGCARCWAWTSGSRRMWLCGARSSKGWSRAACGASSW